MHLKCGALDHKPLIILPLGITPRRQKPWSFEQVWLERESCHAMVRLAWRSENVEVSMAMVEENLQQCQIKLKWWSRVAFGNIVRQLIDKRQ